MTPLVRRRGRRAPHVLSIAAIAILCPACTGSPAGPPPRPAASAPLPVVRPPVPEKPVSAYAYPATRTDGAVDTLHGVTLPDPYRWLEDVKSADVKGWMAAQDALTHGTLAKLADRESLARRLKG